MADWAWRFSLRLTRRVIFSPGGPSAFRRSAWGDFLAGRAPRSWRVRSNTSGCRWRRSGLPLQFCGDISPGKRVPKLTLIEALAAIRDCQHKRQPHPRHARPPILLIHRQHRSHLVERLWGLTVHIHARTLIR